MLRCHFQQTSAQRIQVQWAPGPWAVGQRSFSTVGTETGYPGSPDWRGMLNYLQSIKWSAHHRGDQSSFLTHSTPHPPSISHCPRVHPGLCRSSPARRSGLTRHGAASLAAPALSAPPHLRHSGSLRGIFQRFLIPCPCLLNYPHSDLVFLRVRSAECSHRDHKGERLRCRFPNPALDWWHCSLQRSWENAVKWWTSCLPPIPPF